MTNALDVYLDLYIVALRQWNTAIKNVSEDKRSPRRTAITYQAQRIALEKLQDAILAGEKRYWKRGGEDF